MKRIVITNNKKVQSNFDGKAEIKFMENASPYEIYEEGRKIVENGGKLLVDPSAGGIKNYYKSLAFMQGDDNSPDPRSLELLGKCIEACKDMPRGKEPVLSGIMQKKEVDSLKRILA